MSRYLNLVRQSVPDHEPPAHLEKLVLPEDGINGKYGKSRLVRITGGTYPVFPVYPVPEEGRITPAEAAAIGLDPLLTWMRVTCVGKPVEPSTLPANWAGALPPSCFHARTCQLLGPCPHAVARCGATPEKE